MIWKISPGSRPDQWSKISVQALGSVGDLEDPPKILVRSVISKISSRSRSNQWLRRSVQVLGWISDLENPSKTLLASVVSTINPRYRSDQWSRKFVHILVGSMIGKIRPSSWLEQWPRWSHQDLGCIKDLEYPPKSLLSCQSPILVQDPSCLGDLQDRSKILVGSVTSKTSPRSRSHQCSRRSVQDLGLVSDREDPSKTSLDQWSQRSLQDLVVSVNAKIRPRSWFFSVISKISSRSRADQWSRRSIQALGCLGNLEGPHSFVG